MKLALASSLLVVTGLVAGCSSDDGAGGGSDDDAVIGAAEAWNQAVLDRDCDEVNALSTTSWAPCEDPAVGPDPEISSSFPEDNPDPDFEVVERDESAGTAVVRWEADGWEVLLAMERADQTWRAAGITQNGLDEEDDG